LAPKTTPEASTHEPDRDVASSEELGRPVYLQKCGGRITLNKNHAEYLAHSLFTYFEGGFLFNVDRALQRWQDKGFISQSDLQKKKYFNDLRPRRQADSVQQLFRDELSKKVSDSLGRKEVVGRQNIADLIFEIRKTKIETKTQCRRVFSTAPVY